MKFTKHAIDKMKLFSISEEEVIRGIRNPELLCDDKLRGSTVYIFRVGGKLYSAATKGNLIITIYRTDEKRLYSRIRSGRWNCR
jgi:hypothetical protein